MRRLLFRGKTENGKWAYGSLISANDYCCILESEDNIHPIDYPYLDNVVGTFDGKATPIIPETVGQFTGLLDVSGKKIFEGDIVSCKGASMFDGFKYRDNCVCIGVISFSDGGFGVRFTDAISNILLHFVDDHSEVIGNIYDNPELLEGRIG